MSLKGSWFFTNTPYKARSLRILLTGTAISHVLWHVLVCRKPGQTRFPARPRQQLSTPVQRWKHLHLPVDATINHAFDKVIYLSSVEMDHSSSSQPRVRVACARCRAQKLRCDLGNFQEILPEPLGILLILAKYRETMFVMFTAWSGLYS